MLSIYCERATGWIRAICRYHPKGLIGLAMKSCPYPSAKFGVICAFVNDAVYRFVDAEQGCSAKLAVCGGF
jgi:hypothetical protein